MKINLSSSNLNKENFKIDDTWEIISDIFLKFQLVHLGIWEPAKMFDVNEVQLTEKSSNVQCHFINVPYPPGSAEQ